MKSNMNGKLLFKWIIASALGLGVGFVVSIQTGMLFEFGFNWEKHWNWTGQSVDQDALSYLSILLGWLLAGVILGWTQSLILRSYLKNVAHWILATVSGFGTAAVIMDWPLIAMGVLGSIPGPVEPLIFTVGGCTFAGIFQYLMLRRRGFNGYRWLLLWIIGLVAGVVPTGIIMMSFETLSISMSWPMELFVNGMIVAGTAALFSGKALFKVLSIGK